MDKGHPKGILYQVSRHDGFKQGFFEAEHTSFSNKILLEV